MLRTTLTPQEEQQLTILVRQSPSHRIRQRSQALLWSHQGKKPDQIADLFNVKPDTVTAWFRRWQQQPQPQALADGPRCGRHPKLNPAQKKVSFSR